MTIGAKIKELRKQNGLTQEKLADFLCVSYQAVSKWECGQSAPDLSLIVPLARLLHVTTDELLGAVQTEEDTHRAQLEQAYQNTFQTGDDDERLRITEEAVRTYPGDMMWLNRLAWDIWCRNVDTLSSPDLSEESFEQERERAIKLFDTVIRHTEDDAVKANAITGIVQCLCGKGCRAEARQYVELFPEAKADPAEKNRLFGACLEGEERICHKQHELDDELGTLVRDLLWNSASPHCLTCPAAKAVLEAMIPDGNYGHYHHEMSHIHFRLAEIEAKAGSGKAIPLLEQAVCHAKAYDEIDSVHRGEYTLTAPLFDHLTHDSRSWCRTGDASLLNDIRMMSRRQSFDALREHPTFRALFDET